MPDEPRLEQALSVAAEKMLSSQLDEEKIDVDVRTDCWRSFRERRIRSRLQVRV